MSQLDWVGAPEWAKDLAINSHGEAAWLGDNGYAYIGIGRAFHAWVAPTSFPPESFKVVESRPVVWDGEGLPPVGTICEHRKLIPGKEWTQVEIVAHRAFNGGDYTCAVFVFLEGSSWSSAGDHFRPIRTPEQIAAEERSKACDAMFGIMTSPPVRKGNRSDMAEALYDAGYRKQKDS